MSDPVSSDLGKAVILAEFFAAQCSSNSTDESLGAPYPLPQQHPRFDFQPLRECDVLRQLRKLPSCKSTSDYLISNRTLKECAHQICPSLTYLFNTSLSTNTFPDEWKEATICPIFKNRGNAGDPSNYRPVSLLNAVGKVLDALVCQSLLKYLLQYSLISCHQFGFLPHRSTVFQLLFVFDKWLKALDKNQESVAVFMDFNKAFDKVWHKGLLHKLLGNGLSSDAVAWFQSYLSSRLLNVRVGEAVSAPLKIAAGVP